MRLDASGAYHVIELKLTKNFQWTHEVFIPIHNP